MKSYAWSWPILTGVSWLLTSLVATPAQTPTSPTGQEWEQEQNLALNKEPARATFSSFGDLPSALKILPEHSRYWRSLDGQWKFHWVKHPDERPKDFFQPEYDVSTWKEIPVPSSWQCQGYDVPVYSNQRYLFKRDWPRVMGEPPRNYTAFTNRNPVGSYRRDFEIAGGLGRTRGVHQLRRRGFFLLPVDQRSLCRVLQRLALTRRFQHHPLPATRDRMSSRRRYIDSRTDRISNARTCGGSPESFARCRCRQGPHAHPRLLRASPSCDDRSTVMAT